MDPARGNPFLPFSIGALLLCLAVAPGCCKRCGGTGQKTAQAGNAAKTGTAGVTVTSPVPHAVTTGASTDNEAATPSPGSVPRAVPIGKKPPPIVLPPPEGY